jgi:hypothetical protein
MEGLSHSMYDATAKSRRLDLNAQIELCNFLILFKTFNLKLNTALQKYIFCRRICLLTAAHGHMIYLPFFKIFLINN